MGRFSKRTSEIIITEHGQIESWPKSRYARLGGITLMLLYTHWALQEVDLRKDLTFSKVGWEK